MENEKTANSRLSLLKAIAGVQIDMPRLVKNSTAQVPTKTGRGYEYKYIELVDIWEALRPILRRHGLVVTNTMDGSSMLKTSLIHVDSGEEISCAFPINTSLPPQQVGSAFSYARRYALCALLQIVADKDDDGAAAQTAHAAAPSPGF